MTDIELAALSFIDLIALRDRVQDRISQHLEQKHDELAADIELLRNELDSRIGAR